MTRSAKVSVRYFVRSTTATIALVAGGYLVISGSTAETAASESPNDPTKNETWIEKTYVIGPEAGTKDEAQKQADVESSKEGKSTAASKSRKKRKGGKSVQNAFRPGPTYEKKYDANEQLDIYGGKFAVEPPRPLLEVGRQQYTSGILDESSTLLGELNPLVPGLAVYGDWRTAIAYNKNNGKDIAQIATRLNLDVDFKITATERIHAFFTPFQDGNAKFTRFEFGNGNGDGRFTTEFDAEPQTLFFEGDFGSLYSGFSGKEAGFDLPFTVGLFPLFLQNGIWANDEELGGVGAFQLRHYLLRGVRQHRQRKLHSSGWYGRQ